MIQDQSQTKPEGPLLTGPQSKEVDGVKGAESDTMAKKAISPIQDHGAEEQCDSLSDTSSPTQRNRPQRKSQRKRNKQK